MTNTDWLTIHRGSSPLIVSIPHSGTELHDLESRVISPWLGRKDADWYVDQLYDFVVGMDATLVRTAISRTVIDVNRDPTGISLYPGQATTELCPTLTFDGEPLYREGQAPGNDEIAARRVAFFEPYHAALTSEVERLRHRHSRVVLYDAHSIRSNVPRLFAGVLPNFNIGTNTGKSCDAALANAVSDICARTTFSHVINGRFKGGYITRHYGRPEQGVHAIQMELACRGYLHEAPGPVTESTWPPAYDQQHAAALRAALTNIIEACLSFAHSPRPRTS